VATPRLTWGWEVNSTNYQLPFDRGGNKDASLRYGVYTAAEFATEVARAMNAADAGQTYTCTYSFTTRKFTIANGAAFILEFSRNAATNAAGLLGFNDADTASAVSHASTDTVGNTGANPYFYNAGVYSWAPSDPVHMTTPVSANADGTAASRLQRVVNAVQTRFDSGKVETIYYSTTKEIELHFRWLSAAEFDNFELFLNWIERGRRFNYQPDATSTNALRLVLKDPGQIQAAHEWLARPEISPPPLRFIEQVSRT